jgi:hypothetical protein
LFKVRNIYHCYKGVEFWRANSLNYGGGNKVCKIVLYKRTSAQQLLEAFTFSFVQAYTFEVKTVGHLVSAQFRFVTFDFTRSRTPVLPRARTHLMFEKPFLVFEVHINQFELPENVMQPTSFKLKPGKKSDAIAAPPFFENIGKILSRYFHQLHNCTTTTLHHFRIINSWSIAAAQT